MTEQTEQSDQKKRRWLTESEALAECQKLSAEPASRMISFIILREITVNNKVSTTRLAAMTGISRPAVLGHLKKLEAANLIEKTVEVNRHSFPEVSEYISFMLPIFSQWLTDDLGRLTGTREELAIQVNALRMSEKILVNRDDAPILINSLKEEIKKEINQELILPQKSDPDTDSDPKEKITKEDIVKASNNPKIAYFQKKIREAYGTNADFLIEDYSKAFTAKDGKKYKRHAVWPALASRLDILGENWQGFVDNYFKDVWWQEKFRGDPWVFIERAARWTPAKKEQRHSDEIISPYADVPPGGYK